LDVAKVVKDRRLKNNIGSGNNVNELNKNNIKKWASFSYISKEVIPIAKILKKLNINVAFRTRNTLEKMARM
jgi:regulator of PEP synthase PpsR (kinase-PPPase family)